MQAAITKPSKEGKIITENKLEGRKRKGQPRRKWMETGRPERKKRYELEKKG